MVDRTQDPNMTAGQGLRQAAADTRDSVRELGREARNVAHEKALEAKAGAKALGDTTCDMIRDNPWRSVAIAAGAGLLIGMLMGRGR